MELWIFDRSGLYSSGPFGIHDNPQYFARALVGYATMVDDEMGLDTFIERGGVKRRYVTLDSTASDGGEMRVLLTKPMVCQRAIVCRGTTCYETQDGHVAKFSWASDKRKSASDDNTSDTIMSGPKQQRSSSSFGLVKPPTNENKPSLYARGEESWENRIYSCLVISPAGRVISDFRTAKELLESMQDAIKAHRSLYLIGNILHRDISSNNIIITDPETMADGFRGMLIDLDLAKVRDSGPSGARH